MNQQKHLEDLHEGRGWLNRAAEALNSWEDALGFADFARVAATIGCGYVQLAAVEQQAEMGAGAAQHNERILEMQSVVADAHRTLEGRVRAEQAEIEARTAKLAELDAATLAASGLRERRAAAEARPHDDEQPRFLGFTEHGHPVVDQLPPHALVQCGGAHNCAACADDTGDLRRAAREARPHTEPGQVFIVSDKPIQSWYAAESRDKARAWVDRSSSADQLRVTTVAVDRG